MSVRPGPWTVADVPDQSGRTALVTGANSGIGFEAAAVLARRGADTVLACRDAGKAKAAAARVTAAAPGATVSVVRLDLASLDSVRAAARRRVQSTAVEQVSFDRHGTGDDLPFGFGGQAILSGGD